MFYEKFKSRFILSPMAGVNNIAFREMCGKYHDGINFTEMVSSTALFFKSDKTEKIFEKGDEEKEVGVQIFGSNTEHLVYAAKIISEIDYVSILDINMGCPASKIIKNGDGSALTLDLNKVDEITYEVRKVVNKPFSVKIRIGYYENVINCFDVIKILEKNGVDFITIHGRFAKQMYKGNSNWDVIKEARTLVKTPIIANGDIFNYDDGFKILEHTGCSFGAVARGAQGRPWIFEDLNLYLQAKMENKEYVKKERSHKFIVENLIEHYHKALKYENNKKGILEMRKHAGWYLRGLDDSAEVKREINSLLDFEKILHLLEEYKNM